MHYFDVGPSLLIDDYDLLIEEIKSEEFVDFPIAEQLATLGKICEIHKRML